MGEAAALVALVFGITLDSAVVAVFVFNLMLPARLVLAKARLE